MRSFVLLAGLLTLAGLAPLHAVGQDKGAKNDLPRAFDLRSRGGVTPVKQQIGGTCWAHGTMAAVESHLLVSGTWKKWNSQGFPALSEYHLDWWNGFNRHQNQDLEDVTKDPSGLKVHVGGDYRVAAAYMSRGDGVIALSLQPDNTVDRGWHGTIPERLNPQYKRLYVRNVEWLTLGKDLQNIDAIKRRLIEQGALGTAYAVSKNFISKDFVHYQPLSHPGTPNHAVAIVGWDDDKVSGDPVKKVPGPGAWLIKNSWGTKKGDQGYYWISYYDKYCCRHPEMGAVSFRNVEPMRYSHVYYHDYHGWRDTMPQVAKAFNAFTAAKKHHLAGVSFYTAKDNVRYIARIYQRFENGQLSNERARKSGEVGTTGFHTIDLEAPVAVEKGERFYVYLELSDGGHAFDRTSEIPVLLDDQPKTQPKARAGYGPNGPAVISRAQPGESYYFDGTTWKDLYEHRFQNPDWAIFDRTANFCMKALAVEMGK